MARERAMIFVHRVGEHLVAEAPLDGDLIRRFPSNKRLRAVITMPRNVGKLRLYFAMLNLIRDNIERSPSVETLHEMMKALLGYTVTMNTKRGPVTVPASINFEEMGEDEFTTYFEDFVRMVLMEIIPGIGRQAFERQAMEMIAGPDYDGPRRLTGPSGSST